MAAMRACRAALRENATWVLLAAVFGGTLWTICTVGDTVFRPELLLILSCSTVFNLLLERALPPLELSRDSETRQFAEFVDGGGAVRPGLTQGQLRGIGLLQGCGASSVTAFSFTSFAHGAIMVPVCVTYMACFAGRRARLVLEELPCPGAGGVDLTDASVAMSFFLTGWESGYAVKELGHFLKPGHFAADYVVHSLIALFAPLFVTALGGPRAGTPTIGLYALNHVSTVLLDFRGVRKFSWFPWNFEVALTVAFAFAFLGVRIGYIPWQTAAYLMWSDQQWEVARSCAEWSMPGGRIVREAVGGHSWFDGRDYVLRIYTFLDASLFALNLYWAMLLFRKAYSMAFPRPAKGTLGEGLVAGSAAA